MKRVLQLIFGIVSTLIGVAGFFQRARGSGDVLAIIVFLALGVLLIYLGVFGSSQKKVAHQSTANQHEFDFADVKLKASRCSVCQRVFANAYTHEVRNPYADHPDFTWCEHCAILICKQHCAVGDPGGLRLLKCPRCKKLVKTVSLGDLMV